MTFFADDCEIPYLATSVWLDTNKDLCGKPPAAITKDKIYPDKMKIYRTVVKSVAPTLKAEASANQMVTSAPPSARMASSVQYGRCVKQTWTSQCWSTPSSAMPTFESSNPNPGSCPCLNESGTESETQKKKKKLNETESETETKKKAKAKPNPRLGPSTLVYI